MTAIVLGGLASAGVVLAFVAVVAAVRRWRLPAAVSPVLVTALLTGAVLAAAGVPLQCFQQLTAPLHLVLGPAIVALGAGVHGSRRAFAAAGRPLAAAIVAGAVTGVGSALGLARWLGLGPLLTAATLTRTLTTPFAILVQSRVGGPVSLAAGIAVATGVIGAIGLPPLLRRLGCRDSANRRHRGRRRRAPRWRRRPSGATMPSPGPSPGRGWSGSASSSRWSCRRYGHG